MLHIDPQQTTTTPSIKDWIIAIDDRERGSTIAAAVQALLDFTRCYSMTTKALLVICTSSNS
jgi:hypothetical protein